MTLEKYERDLAALKSEAQNFSGTPEEAAEFLSKLSEKYSEVCKFNEAALACKDLEEFKTLADSVGLEFSAEEPVEKLFSRIQTSKGNLSKVIKSQANGAELDDESLDTVTGGGVATLVVGTVVGLVGGSIAGAVAGAKNGEGVKDVVIGMAQGAGTGAVSGALFGMLAPGP